MLNKVILIGNVGNDPEVRATNTGDTIANVSLATTEHWKDQAGNRKEKTEWHRVVFFGKVADVVSQYVTKGSKIYLEGQLQTRKWQDQQGQDKYTTEVIVSGFNSKLLLLGSNNNQPTNATVSNQSNSMQQQPVQQPVQDPALDDDIPF